MTSYEIHLHETQTIQSLLVDTNGSAVINTIVYDNDDDGEMLPLNEVTYPISFSVGKKLVTLSKPITAKRIEFIGSGLEFIRGVSVNDTTLGNDLQSKIDAVQEQINTIVAGNMAYVHNQDVPSDTWTINHTLGYNPNVTVVDSAGSVVTGDVLYVNSTQLILTFNGAFAGKAYLS